MWMKGEFALSMRLKGAGMVNKRILLVDDVTLFLQLGKTMLARRNMEVDTATSGTEALEKTVLNPPDLIFLDLYMPDMNGDEVCRRLKRDSRTAGIPVIILTSEGDEEIMSSCFAAGCDDYITKPIRMEVLQNVLERHLEERARRHLRAAVNIPCRLLREEERREATMLSLSPFGAFLRMTPLPLPETVYTLAFDLPGDVESVEVDAFPRWTRKLSENSPEGSGFEFQNLDKDQFEGIGRFVIENIQ